MAVAKDAGIAASAPKTTTTKVVSTGSTAKTGSGTKPNTSVMVTDSGYKNPLSGVLPNKNAPVLPLYQTGGAGFDPSSEHHSGSFAQAGSNANGTFAGGGGNDYNPGIGVKAGVVNPSSPDAGKVGGAGANGGLAGMGMIVASGSGAGDNGGSNGGGSNGGGSNGGGSRGGSGGGYGGGGGYYGGGGAAATPAGVSNAELLAQNVDTTGLGGEVSPYQLPEMPGPNPERLEHVDDAELRSMLQQIVDAQKEQSQNAIDYNVQRETEALNRAMQDAAPMYQTQRDQLAAEEAQALDNQALYSEARGDRGGIGEAQYASIQAAANQNRRAVNDAQVKLSTDTARQISDLRAQGEFEKADQLLSITQSYLSQLMNLEQWAIQQNLSVDEFNSQLQKWVDEYNLNVKQYLTDLDLSAAKLTGVFSNGARTREAQNQLLQTLSNSGAALLNAGVLPSQQQLAAMGMTEVQARAYIANLKR